MNVRISWRPWLLACLATIVQPTAAQDVPLDPRGPVAAYPAQGLSPLYQAAGEECRRLLADAQQWEVLPRPINAVLATPDQPPTFEMHSGDTYYNGLPGNAEAIRRAAEQSWDGGFRLLYNIKALVRDGDDFWLTIDGFTPTLKFVSGKQWTTYRPLGSGGFNLRAGGGGFLDKDKDGAWCIACSEGLYRLQDGQWERIRIPGWPGGAAQGIVADGRGRIVAWSERAGTIGPTLAFLSNDKWSVIEAQRAGVWIAAGIRADGSAVLASNSQLVIARPLAASPAAGDDKPKLVKRQNQFPLGDDHWATVTCVAMATGSGSEKNVAICLGSELVRGVPTVTRRGNALFVTPPLGDGASGLVRLLSEGPPQWIPFAAPAGNLQIAAARDDGFLLLGDRLGIYLLDKDSQQPRQIAKSAELLPGDKLLGCDDKGRVYLQRGVAILMFSPRAKPAAALEVREIAEVFQRAAPNSFLAAVDSTGACWYAAQGGAVMVLAPGQKDAQRRDDRLGNATALWPGRGGAMLTQQTDGGAALAHGANKLELGKSLLELARASFDAMLAAAPTASRDERRTLQQAGRRKTAAPWLATGKCLWINDGKAVHRLRKVGAADSANIEAKTVREGAFQMLGPLASGHLLLAQQDQNQNARLLTSWFWVEDPEGKAEVKPVASPPKENGGGSLEAPASFMGEWHLDAKGYLWLHQGFDRAYRLGSPGVWPMLKSLGQPEFEYPSGLVWSHHSSRVFAGYEVAGPGFRRSCQPTYAQHLTPLFAEAGRVVCLTPDGMAWLQFDPDHPDKDAVDSRYRILWGERPAAYIGHSGHRAFFLTVGVPQVRLVSVELPENFADKN